MEPFWSRNLNLSIKNAPEDLVARLRARAARHHRSLQGELLAIVEAAAREQPALAAKDVFGRFTDCG